ncbi:MAG: hypothetical protein DWQ01_18660 [Planctomycetota bacterium]|nr:MAG: hypothetical protein DWQ01_18660 [Planctomycetota bacterium]
MLILSLFMLSASFQQAGGKWIKEHEIHGSFLHEELGRQVVLLGDLDGDRHSEVLVAAPGADLGVPFPFGKVRVFSGSTQEILFETTSADFSNASVIGRRAERIGDVDQDGLPDFALATLQLIAEPYASIIVVSGGTFQVIARLFSPPGSGNLGGRGLAGGVDLSGDGIPDLVASDEYYTGSLDYQGAVFAYDSTTWQPLWVAEGNLAWLRLGQSLACIHDINGDGYNDVLTASSYAGSEGSVHALSGKDGSEIYRIDGIPGWSYLGIGGFAVVPDINGDGIEDFVTDMNPRSVSTYQFGFLNVYSGADGALLHQIQGDVPNNGFPNFVVNIGDVDQDGFEDVATSAVRQPTPGNGRGVVYVYSGRNWQVLARIPAPPKQSWFFGWALSGGEDVTGDGRVDLGVGDHPAHYSGIIAAGAAYIYSFEPFLRTSVKQVSASSGGQVDFDLQFPPEEAGKKYRMLVSTDLPGSIVLGKMEIPLKHTPLTWAVAHNPPNWFTGSRGTLDANAHATASAVFPANKFTSHVGTTLKFVALTMRPIRKPDRSSAAVYVEIVP